MASSATYATSTTIDISGPSIPAGTPSSIFQSERYDLPAGQPMMWSFPVTPGSYEVRLYLAELYFTTVGARVFSVSIEGQPILENYDIYKEVGVFKGVVKSFTVSADATLDIVFTAVVENPKISAIEILQAASSPGELRASTESLGFGAVLVGQTTTRTLQITNAGAAGDPNIGVYGTTITGLDSTEFSDDFNDGSTVTLAPGESINITVSFAPVSDGAKTAALEISHFGVNHPLVVLLSGSGAVTPPGTWQTRAASGVIRQEVAYAQLGGRFYLAGGGTAHEVYDPSTDTWSALAPLPANLDHIQSVALGGRIYYIGGLLAWPGPAVSTVSIYDPATDSITQGEPMPRPRGAGGVAVHNGKIYYAGGLAAGDVVSWFDVYDPVANKWTALPNMPVARDHFHAAVVGGKFYVTGGRAKAIDALISSTVAFDFGTGTWQTSGLAPIPTPRGGFGAAVLGDEIIVIGGEGGGLTFNTVEAYNTSTNAWRTVASMPTARHGIQAAECNGGIYVAAGGTTQGGSTPTNVHEVFFLGSAASCGSPSTPPPSQTLFRVNAGGPAVSATPGWSADTSSAPSPYSNVAAASSGTFISSSAISVSHPSVPAGTPASLFQSERYDQPAGSDMVWSFPVTPGSYEVRLYFAEIYFTSPGARVFNVSIEGSTVLANYDIVADVGAFQGVVKSFQVVSDSTLGIAFGRVFENPKISAIEIISTGAKAGELGVAPTSLQFSEVVLGQTTSQTLQLTNLGAAGDPTIVVNTTTITGTHSSQFTDNFNDAAGITLEPQQSTTVTVAFAPTTVGSKTASLEIAHTGTNAVAVPLSGSGIEAQIGFGKSALTGTSALSNPTSLQFGPDGRLYVSQQDGLIRIYTVVRNTANSYSVGATEVISSINSVPNHNDDGTLNSNVTTRLITGILVVGTASNPVIYVAHSDPRIGGGSTGEDLNLDTNSSMVSRLTWTGSAWQKLDLVRGLPRSEENHAANGMQLDPVNNILYVGMGGNTNKGATSNNFAYLPEFALSAAILSIDLGAIGNATYDLPTLNDETRPGNPDANDPFGGNNGLNQARLVPGGPVQVYAPGFRNPYDLAITRSGRMYTIDNGGNAGWGDVPINEGPAGNCTNAPNEPGTTSPDGLHFVSGPGYYGGHPNPTRGNLANTFNPSNPQSPVTVANPVECDYREAGPESGALVTFPASTNGLAEYVAGNFSGAMQGNLLASSWNGVLYRVQLNSTGTAATQMSSLFSSMGSLPLDVVAESPFPGTIWVALYGGNQILAFEPNDYSSSAPVCTGAYDLNLDEDLDGYSNADEKDNLTNPCSAADTPPDWDGDFLSDLNDPDDDNDGIPDETDAFALDPLNGTGTPLPVNYWWENDGDDAGGILNLGFTGLMINGVTNYASMYDPSEMTAGGAAGVMTIDRVSPGDAYGLANNQEYGFQFGVRAYPGETGPFFAHTRILGPFAGLEPLDGQSMGLFVGTGDQDNYVKVVVSGTAGGGLAVVREVGGVPVGEGFSALPLPGPNYIDLYLRVDPAGATVQAFYSATTGGVTGAQVMLTPPLEVPTSWFNDAARGLAVGLISTSGGSGQEFPATYDFVSVVPDTDVPLLGAVPSNVNFGAVTVGQSAAIVVQLTNLGTTDLVVDATTISGTHAAQFSDNFNDATDVTLAPGAMTTITVTFAPNSTGSKTATLAIAHSGGNTPLQVPLTGSGQAPVLPTLAASPTALSFGNVVVGQTAALVVQLTNTGTSSLVVHSTNISGNGASQFSDSFNDATGVNLAPGASASFTVTFAPTSNGAKKATLQVVHSGANTPLLVQLSGSGTRK